MEIIYVPVSEFHTSSILNHKDFVKYNHTTDQVLLDESRHIKNVHGFLHRKAVVVQYEGE